MAAALPLLVTGGIHADGFCDTVDALSSHAEREKMLEILKDSHCGAFAVIFFGLWLVLWLAGWAALDRPDTVLCAALGLLPQGCRHGGTGGRADSGRL